MGEEACLSQGMFIASTDRRGMFIASTAEPLSTARAKTAPYIHRKYMNKQASSLGFAQRLVGGSKDESAHSQNYAPKPSGNLTISVGGSECWTHGVDHSVDFLFCELVI